MYLCKFSGSIRLVHRGTLVERNQLSCFGVDRHDRQLPYLCYEASYTRCDFELGHPLNCCSLVPPGQYL
jgi:hypothetical protein